MNGRFVDMTGKRFNRLFVIEFSHIDNNHLAKWKCLCDCGNIIVVSGASLRKGNTNSCGCYKRDKIREAQYKDLIGYRFGYLVVLADVGRLYNKIAWECQCDCGNRVIATGGDLRAGKYISCGCNKNWTGNKNPKWRGGASKKLYPPIWEKRLRRKIRDLDFHQCRFAKCDYRDDIIGYRKLDVHHIDGNKENCDETNLISLCNSHHGYVESHHPERFMEYFYLLIGNRA